MKKVLLIIIDALSSRVVDPALTADRLPNLRRLRDAATLRGDSISIFPSITPAATSSLVTGRYPHSHGISGAYWYMPGEKTVVYYGYDIWAILEKGIVQFIKDFLVKLNEEHLQATTLFQTVEKAGLTAASLNYLIYHGESPHNLDLPLLLKLLPDTSLPATVGGPSLLYFGDIIQTPLQDGHKLSAPGGLFHRFGFADDTTAELLTDLAQAEVLPDFTLAYFPENDFRSHEVGPEMALNKLEELDEKLGKIFDAFGGLSELLSKVCVVLTGDHSQSSVVESTESAGIRLDQLLSAFAVAPAGMPMTGEEDLVACPNLRTAQIYFHTPTAQRFARVTEELLQDTRIDQLLWSADFLEPGKKGFHVVTQNRGRLHFWAGDEGPQSAQDLYGNVWSWQGNLQTVDGHIADNVITFGDYPNAFERIAGILDLSTSGHLWVTSRPGYEFCLEHTLIHAGGGSHGSLHVLDSVSPLWVAGAPTGMTLPPQPRAVDVLPLCLASLGLPSEYQPGDARMQAAS
ncbi:MAG: alkaline phosphatase family protein [Caldilineaceae bacterium]